MGRARLLWDQTAPTCLESRSEDLSLPSRVAAAAVIALALIVVSTPLFLALRLLVDPSAFALAFS